jgi:Kef-type K+ transport system membrane component KefB
MHIADILLSLIIILISARVLGELAQRVGQPGVLGELIAGVIIGESILGLIHHEPTLDFLAEIGVILLLFEIGLETEIKELIRVGIDSLFVALAGITLPFALGYLAMRGFGTDSTISIFAGATLVATSIGITAKVLADLGKLYSLESRIIIGAAVIDDILGLIILSLLAVLAETGSVSIQIVGIGLIKAIGFLIAAVVIGNILAPQLIKLVDRMRGRGVLFIAAFVFAVALSYLADKSGLALIIGAFAAGTVLAGTHRKEVIEDNLKPLVDVFTPVFFVMVGASVNLSVLNPLNPDNRGTLLIVVVLTAVAVIGKLASGYFTTRKGINRLAIGLGMLPRGEVGLIFAQLGKSTGLFSDQVFSALVSVVVLTTFLAPPLLSVVFKKG